MSLATLNGLALTSATLTIPRTGAWLFTGDTSEPVSLATGNTVELGIADDMTLAGTVTRATEFEGSTRFRVVGGRSGWTVTVQPRAYTSGAGLSFAQLAQDAARDAGETLASTVPAASVGTKFARILGPASQVFALLAPGQEWWVDDLGVTQVGARAAGVTTEAFQLIALDGAAGKMTIATDRPSAFRPGQQAPTANSGTFTINSIVWHVTTDALRGDLWIA